MIVPRTRGRSGTAPPLHQRLFRCLATVERARITHCLGTGVVGIHPSILDRRKLREFSTCGRRRGANRGRVRLKPRSPESGQIPLRFEESLPGQSKHRAVSTSLKRRPHVRHGLAASIVACASHRHQSTGSSCGRRDTGWRGARDERNPIAAGSCPRHTRSPPSPSHTRQCHAPASVRTHAWGRPGQRKRGGPIARPPGIASRPSCSLRQYAEIDWRYRLAECQWLVVGSGWTYDFFGGRPFKPHHRDHLPGSMPVEGARRSKRRRVRHDRV